MGRKIDPPETMERELEYIRSAINEPIQNVKKCKIAGDWVQAMDLYQEARSVAIHFGLEDWEKKAP